MPAFGLNRFSIPFVLSILEKEMLVSEETEEPVYQHIGFRLSDRILSAVDRLCSDLVSRFSSVTYPGLKRFGFIYPFVGGLDWTHAMNLADEEGGYQKNSLIWGGTGAVTHNANGITMPATASANTQADCGNAAPDYPRWWIYKTFGFYSRTNSTDTARTITASKTQGTVSYYQGIHPRSSDGNVYYQNVYTVTGGTAGGSMAYVATPDSLGLFVLSRENSTLMRCFKRGVQITYDNVTATPGLGTGTAPAIMYLTGTRNLAFAFSTIHMGFLSYNENLAFYPLIQRFQVALLRQV